MFKHAIVRTPGPDFHLGITTSNLGAPDYELMLAQHNAYVAALKQAELEVVALDPLPGYPDAYFVEDAAVVTPDVAVITNPGADSRKGEIETIAGALSNYRPVRQIEPPGTLDGGDVMMVGRHFFIGLSQRTNLQGAEQLGAILEQHGSTWSTIPVGTGLHLKSAVGWAGGRTIIEAFGFDGAAWFADYERVTLHRADGYAANSLVINDHILTPSGFPRVRAILEQSGLNVVELDMSECRKMDGGLSCLSLRF